MLNQNTLQNQLQSAFEDIIPSALEEAFKTTLPCVSEEGDDIAKDFGKHAGDLLCEPLATAIAAAVDYYVHNISISGTIITSGTAISQMASIHSPTPITNGIIPNSLKIS